MVNRTRSDEHHGILVDSWPEFLLHVTDAAHMWVRDVPLLRRAAAIPMGGYIQQGGVGWSSQQWTRQLDQCGWRNRRSRIWLLLRSLGLSILSDRI